jgi:CcmD family protein
MKKLARMLAFVLALSASPALAEQAAEEETSEEDAAESRAATFEAADGAQAESVPGGTLLIAAYGIVWLLLFGFVASIALRQARTSSELERLKRELAKKKD